MGASIRIYTSGIDEIQQALEAYGDGAGKVLQQVLYNEGSMEISERITDLLPVSGRKFRGHNFGAKASGPTKVFTRWFPDPMTLEVKTRPPKFSYLYFPDTGTGHQPRVQDFMGRGLEAATPKVIELCLAKLTEDI